MSNRSSLREDGERAHTPLSSVSTTSSIADAGAEVPAEKPKRGRGRRKANLMEDTYKKRKKADLNANVDRTKPDKVGKAERLAMTRLFEACFKQVENCKAEDGRRRCELFLEIPSKKLYPDYYVLIETPIALDIINTRIHSTYYDTVQDFINDFRLMFGNARKYNQEGSWVYIDSIEMEKDMDLKLNELYKDQKLIITDEDRKEEQKYLEQLKASENTINSLKRPAPNEANTTENKNLTDPSVNGNINKENDDINEKPDDVPEVNDNLDIDNVEQPSRKKQKRSEDDEDYKDIDVENDDEDEDEDNDY